MTERRNARGRMRLSELSREVGNLREPEAEDAANNS